ncbi:MAG: hydroxyacid dehydrogenase [Lentisphaeria bacterium]|nr:hydroxyacid dehydrogenase [Lentisphaeria bacterium]
MIKAIFLCNQKSNIDRVYGGGRKETVAELTDLCPEVIHQDMLTDPGHDFTQVEVVFSTWGMPTLTEEQLATCLPGLKAVFYAAGSVRKFAAPFLNRGITVSSAWQANAIPVAEYTTAQIVLANKFFFRNAALCSHSVTGRRSAVRDMPGNFGETVTLLGAGAIGRKVVELLQPFNLNILVWDPFLSAESAAALGVEKVDTLTEGFRRGLVVSNHLANVPETVGLLTREQFSSMRPNATFINTGRGATVNEADLAAVFESRPDLTALLDVTHPEPPEENSPLYALPNVILTSHIAGSIGDEVIRMADFAISDFKAWRKGQTPRYNVTPELLQTMA